MQDVKFININNDLSNVDNYLNEFARIHLSAYSKNHFTSLFNYDKLKEYYKYLILNSNLSLLVFSGNVPSGFIVSGTQVSAGVKMFSKANRGYLVQLLLLNPRFLLEKAKAYLFGLLIDTHVNSVSYRLLSIAVDNTTQSKGIGRQLLIHFEDALKSMSINQYGLSVRTENRRAINFYLQNGFEIEFQKRGTLYLIKKIV